VGRGAGHRPPYGTACLIFGLAEEFHLKSYVRGKLALAGIDLRVPADTWLDAVYAIVVEAPHEVLEKVHGQFIVASARIAPDRDSWGALPEHVALTNKLTGLDRPGAPRPARRATAPPGHRAGP
jgi:hypothetical protein